MDTGIRTSLLPSIKRFLIPTFPSSGKVAQRTVRSFVHELNRNHILNNKSKWGYNKDYYPFKLYYGSKDPKVIYNIPRNLPENWHVILSDSGFIKTATLVVSENGQVFTCDKSGSKVDKKIGDVRDLLESLKSLNDGLARQVYQAYRAKYRENFAGYEWILPLLKK